MSTETSVDTNTNMPLLSVGKAMEYLREAFVKIINNNVPVNLLPSVMLWGPPGVGKSQGVRQLAADIEKGTGKQVHVTDARLLLFNPIDLRGIPTSNEDKTLAVWLKPKIFQMDDSADVINILFLDEISAAPPSVQAAAYQITLDRTIGEHKLPDNCIVIAAGNRVTDKSVAVKMPKALANRLCHMEIEGDFKSWKEWAVSNGINEKIVGFLTFRPAFLMGFDAAKDDLAFTTPRSWEMASNILNSVSDDIDRSYTLIAGCIGSGAAVEFRTWCAIYDKLPDIKEIFDGKCTDVPQQTDVMYAVISSMVSYAAKHKDELDKIANSIGYAQKLPPDFATILLKDYMFIEPDYQYKLMNIPAFSTWLSKNGRYFNHA
jgi:hypothetical protein